MQRPTLYFSFAPNHPLTQTSFSPQLSRLQALQKRASSSLFFSRHKRERAFEKRGFLLLLLRRPPCPIASSEDVPGKESEGGSPLSLRLRRRKGGGGGRRNTKGSAGEGEGREAERQRGMKGREEDCCLLCRRRQKGKATRLLPPLLSCRRLLPQPSFALRQPCRQALPSLSKPTPTFPEREGGKAGGTRFPNGCQRNSYQNCLFQTLLLHVKKAKE